MFQTPLLWPKIPKRCLFSSGKYLYPNTQPKEQTKKENKQDNAYKNKVAMVTGGASGIGLECALALLWRGCEGVAIADTDGKKGEEALKIIGNEFGNGKAVFIKCDVTKSELVDWAFKNTIRTFGKVDIVVNSAAILNDDNWEKEVATNINGCLTGSLLGLQYMNKTCHGHGGIVINVASTMGLKPFFGCPIYSMTQAGIIGLTRALSQGGHIEKTGVKVMAVCAGLTDTPMIKKATSDKSMNNRFTNELKRKLKSKQLQSPCLVGCTILSAIDCNESGAVWVIENGEHPYRIKLPPYKDLKIKEICCIKKEGKKTHEDKSKKLVCKEINPSLEKPSSCKSEVTKQSKSVSKSEACPKSDSKKSKDKSVCSKLADTKNKDESKTKGKGKSCVLLDTCPKLTSPSCDKDHKKGKQKKEAKDQAVKKCPSASKLNNLSKGDKEKTACPGIKDAKKEKATDQPCDQKLDKKSRESKKSKEKSVCSELADAKNKGENKTKSKSKSCVLKDTCPKLVSPSCDYDYKKGKQKNKTKDQVVKKCSSDSKLNKLSKGNKEKTTCSGVTGTKKKHATDQPPCDQKVGKKSSESTIKCKKISVCPSASDQKSSKLSKKEEKQDCPKLVDMLFKKKKPKDNAIKKSPTTLSKGDKQKSACSKTTDEKKKTAKDQGLKKSPSTLSKGDKQKSACSKTTDEKKKTAKDQGVKKSPSTLSKGDKQESACSVPKDANKTTAKDQAVKKSSSDQKLSEKCKEISHCQGNTDAKKKKATDQPPCGQKLDEKSRDLSKCKEIKVCPEVTDSGTTICQPKTKSHSDQKLDKKSGDKCEAGKAKKRKSADMGPFCDQIFSKKEETKKKKESSTCKTGKEKKKGSSDVDSFCNLGKKESKASVSKKSASDQKVGKKSECKSKSSQSIEMRSTCPPYTIRQKLPVEKNLKHKTSKAKIKNLNQNANKISKEAKCKGSCSLVVKSSTKCVNKKKAKKGKERNASDKCRSTKSDDNMKKTKKGKEGNSKYQCKEITPDDMKEKKKAKDEDSKCKPSKSKNIKEIKEGESDSKCKGRSTNKGGKGDTAGKDNCPIFIKSSTTQ